MKVHKGDCMADIQTAPSLLMVRPVSFGFDQETAQSNTFQHDLPLRKEALREQACREFDTAIEQLEKHDIPVTVFEDSLEPEKPDAVFPNNWLSTWPDGALYLYPMATAARRIERSETAVMLLKEHWNIIRTVDLSASENDGRYLESTGVMIFDHVHKIVYGCLSIRCDETLFLQHAIDLGYKPIIFHAVDGAGIPIYHTNVLMGVQTSTAVICLETIKDSSERTLVETTLQSTGHDIVPITLAQMNSFCGNILEVKNRHGSPYIIMSQTAYEAFTETQREQLSRHALLLPIAIPTIETVGGGSARCMMAEIFLPLKIEN